ncbi:MAG: Ald Xan dh protein [Dehalococcoidia bacterium]|nr:Ald Xan dh protein [Dehalococcoidia bacterium]
MGNLKVVGTSVPRIDALEKVTGKATYTGDITLPHMLYARVLRSLYPHARIIGINVSRAEGVAGVRAIVTGKDVSNEKMGFIEDRPVLAREVVRFVGEPVAAVAAETVEAAEEAIGLIEVDYEEMPAVFDPLEAMRSHPRVVVHPDLPSYRLPPAPLRPQYRFDPDLPNIYYHHKVRHGDVERGFQEADLAMENRFITPRMHHAQIEPHSAVARPEPDGGLTVWVADHMAMAWKSSLCRIFGLQPSKVRVIAPYIGGGFGGKANWLWPAPIASLLALKTQRPVNLVFSREEVFIDGTTDIPMIVDIKDGIKRDGTLLAREMRVVINCGAYNGMIVRITRNCAFGAAGTYRVPNFKWDSYCVTTNEPPAGPLRGFGCTQVIWAIESQMDMMAVKLGIDPVEIRRKNILKEGERDVTGMTAYNTGAAECLEKAAKWLGWGERPPHEGGLWRIGKGIALASKYTTGMSSAVIVKVHEDASVEIRHSAHEEGQGCNTVLAQIAAEEFATTMDKVKMVFTDSAITPYDSGTVSSRTTFATGNALRLACQDAKRQLLESASRRLQVPAEELSIGDGKVYSRAHAGGGGELITSIGDLFMPGGLVAGLGEVIGRGQYTCPTSTEDPATGQGERPVAYYAHGACAAEVAANVNTGEVRVLRLAQCWDMAQPVNPKLCEGQIEGGTAMGIGRALYEEMMTESGVLLNPNFADYKLPTLMEVPTEQIGAMTATPQPHREGPFGAKGFSEGAILAVSPAIANAVYDAVGARLKHLPITREKMLESLRLRPVDDSHISATG